MWEYNNLYEEATHSQINWKRRAKFIEIYCAAGNCNGNLGVGRH